MGQCMHFIQRKAVLECITNEPDALRPGFAKFTLQLFSVSCPLIHSIDTYFKTAQGLLEGFLEGTTDGHDFADRLHLRGQPRISRREFLESETRDLGHHVIDRRLKRCRRFASSNIVGQLIERIAYSQLGRHFGNRETGRLRSQCR